MSKSNELLPLGSIVYLEEGTRKLVVVGRGVIFDDPVKGTKNIVNKVGNGIKGVANAVSNGIGGIGKALGFG